MNNLKRVLSLALASVMLIGMMAVSASATSFTDDKDIENKEAVGTMVALNIIDGMGDGTYDPKGLLLREQAAKMVFVALNGGQKNDNLTTKEVGTFSDVKKGNWAEGYIEWCYNRGIIAGIGGGLFNPKGNLTGTQLAKIMLVAIGYDAKTEGLEGTNDWALNVNALALKKGFYKGLGAIDPEANITRDQAALLILNACNAPMVEYDYKIVGNNGSISTLAVAKDVSPKETILSESYDSREADGVLYKYSYDKTAKTFKYFVNADTAVAMGAGAVNYQFTTDQDFTAFLGQRVKVLFKGTYSANKNEVYGMANESNIVETTTVGELATSTSSGVNYVTADNSYKMDKGVAAWADVYEAKPTPVDAGYDVNAITAAEPSTVKLVDADNDGEIDWAILTPVTVQQVTYVSSTGITAGAGYTFKNDKIYDGAAKGDFVTVVDKVYNYDETTNVIEKATVVEGTVTRVRTDDNNDNSDLEVDGTWYYKPTAQVGTSDAASVKVGNDVTLVVVGSYYYNVKINTKDVTDLVLVTYLGTGTAKYEDAIVLYPDGSDGEVNVVSVDGKAKTDTGYTAPTAGKLYAYTVDDTGAYKLSTITLGTQAGYALFDTVSGAVTATTTDLIPVTNSKTYRIADDAVVFVYKTGSENSATVVSGKTVKAWETNWGSAGLVLGEVVNGFETAKVAVVSDSSDAPGTAGTLKYGYVVSKKATLSKEGTKYYVNFQIWNGTEVVDVKEQGDNGADTFTNVAKYSQNNYVRYQDKGDGIVSKTEALLNAGTYDKASASDALLGFWNTSIVALEDKDIKLAADGVKATANTYKLTADTVIIGVDSKNKAGVEGASLAIAAETSTPGTYVKNAWALIDKTGGSSSSVFDTGDKIIAIFFDVSK